MSRSKCPKCSGSGWVLYPASARWHGPPSGQDEVSDLCDACHGSGIRGGTESFCSCLLAPGAWGLGGWHQHRQTVQHTLWWACVDRARTDPRTMQCLRAYSEGRAGASDVDAVERLRADVWRSEHAAIMAAAGKPWAFERCGAYQHKVASSISGERQTERAGDLRF